MTGLFPSFGQKKPKSTLTHLARPHSSAQSTALSLPEILHVIFGFLSQHTLRSSARFVSKTWHSISQEYILLAIQWQDRLLSNYPVEKRDLVLQELAKVKVLKIVFEQLVELNATTEAWEALMERMKVLVEQRKGVGLQQVVVDKANFLRQRLMPMMAILGRTMTRIRLQDIQQTKVEISFLLAECPALRVLYLGSTKGNAEVVQEDLLCLAGRSSFSTSSGLVDLTLETMMVQQQTLVAIAQACPALQKLHIICCTVATRKDGYSHRKPMNPSELILAIASACPRIVSFHLSFLLHALARIGVETLTTAFPTLRTLSVWKNDFREAAAPVLKEYIIRQCSPTGLQFRNCLTTLEITGSWEDVGGNVALSHTLQDILCCSPCLLHLLAPTTVIFAEYMDLNGPVDEDGYFYPRTCLSDRARSTFFRIKKRLWACRGLKTLHIEVKGVQGDDSSAENARIMFGYLVRVCPNLEDLSLRRSALNVNLEGGLCLLTRLKHLERLSIKTLGTVVFNPRDIAWVAQRNLSKNSLVLAGAFLMHHANPKQLFSSVSSISQPSTSSPQSSAKSDTHAMLDPIKVSEQQRSAISIKDMALVGTLQDLENWRAKDEHAKKIGKTWWPKLESLHLSFYICQRLRINGYYDDLQKRISKLRPDIKFTWDNNQPADSV